MSERPFMQLYVSDFVGDTLHLSTELVGAYLLLLMAMWNAGGALPNEERKLATIARLSLKKWRAIAGDLMAFFTVEGDEVTHNRLRKELRKSQRKTEVRADAGARGGNARALKDKGSGLAIAGVLPRHLPDTRVRRSASRSVPTEGLVQLDRHRDEALFRTCEQLSEPVPPYMQFKSFPAAIVERARRSIAASAAGAGTIAADPQAAPEATRAGEQGGAE